MSPLRAGLYLRVSQAERGKLADDTSRSVNTQDKECRADADRDGAEIVEVYTDDGQSASRYRRKERTDYPRMVADVEAGKLDILYAWESSRLQRELEVYARLRNLCRANNVLWSLNGKRYDFSRKGDRLASGFEAIMSEEEAEDIRERALRGIRTNVNARRPRSRVLYGYRRRYDPATGKLLGQDCDPDEAPLVREAADRVLAGETATAVAQRFAARGRVTRFGKPWDSARIRRMLINPSYANKKVWRGEIVGDGTWPKIVTVEEHHRLVAILTDPARSSHIRDSATRHLLSKLAVCGICDSPVRVTANRNKKKQSYPAYSCPDGYHATRNEARVDEYVVDCLLRRLAAKDAAQYVARDDAAVEQMRDAAAEAQALRQQLQEYYDAAAARTMSTTGLLEMEARLLPQIDDADQRARPAHVPTTVRELVQAPTLEAMREVWESFTMPQRRQIVRTFLQVRILPVGQGGRLTPIADSVDVRFGQDHIAADA